MMRIILVNTVLAFLVMVSCGERGSVLQSKQTPPTKGGNKTYVSSRAPLHNNPLIKLPIGNIEPKGWLLSQLQLQRDGFIGHLPELSPFITGKSGWATFKSGDRGWEEVPYWLKGYGDLGYILRDSRLIEETNRWLTLALNSQDGSGYFGPPDNKEKHDLWPNMVMLFVAQSRYEATGDRRILPFMISYFKFQADLPEENLLSASWQKFRGGENLQSIYWLYNRTGETFLLDLAETMYSRTHDWEKPILSKAREEAWKPSEFYHGVNIAMGLRYPGLWFQQKRNDRLLEAVEANYSLVMNNYGQPGGMFGADENIRPGFHGPEQGAETCTMVELMHSFETLLSITGSIVYADRCEEIAFNSFPASMTPDLKGLHYLTAANLISCDSSGDHTFENGGEMVSFNPWRYRCCQHNVAFGWPYFAEHLWMATLDQGLAAVLYAPCSVSAHVGEECIKIHISEDTAYPFDEEIIFTVHTDEPVEFPLYLRVPGWCSKMTIMINAHILEQPVRDNYALLRRRWQNGDQIRIRFDMPVTVKTWQKFENAVSVRRGPLWYSLLIDETWKQYAGTDKWPAFEILPDSPWNYALRIDKQNPGKWIQLARQQRPAYQPFQPEDAPVRLEAKGKRDPTWTMVGRMVGPVPKSPVSTDAAEETIALIPMGCARLRITVFPQLD